MVPLLGAIAGCHCSVLWLSGRGAIAGCHCRVPLWCAMVEWTWRQSGAVAECHCGVLWLSGRGAIAGCHCRVQWTWCHCWMSS